MQSALDAIVGQPRAVEELRAHLRRPVHAYMFVGPSGAGKLDAARAFAADLVGRDSMSDTRVLHGAHPDVEIVERVGASISVDQARAISHAASRSSVEGGKKILILNEFHLVEEAAPALLKTIEDANESTVFIVVAEAITPDLVTVASRCVKVEFQSIDPAVIADVLISEGVDEARAREASADARGSLTRARLLATDDGVVARREMWQSVMSRLNGSGHLQWEIANEVTSALDAAVQPLVARQENELAEQKQRERDQGVKAPATRLTEAAHKREQRRLRTDEIRSGLLLLQQMIGKTFVDAATGSGSVAEAAAKQLEAIAWAQDALQYNPGETLLLQGLFARLDAAKQA